MAQGKQKVSWDLCRSNLDLEEYETLLTWVLIDINRSEFTRATQNRLKKVFFIFFFFFTDAGPKVRKCFLVASKMSKIAFNLTSVRSI